MRHRQCGLLAIVLVLATAVTARAGDNAAKALVDKAVQAQGGEHVPCHGSAASLHR
jgi:hypothetical protein